MRKNRKLALTQIVFLLFASSFIYSQKLIQGIVVDGKGLPVVGASALLLRSKDSLLVKGSITTKDGSYVFKQVIPGSYFIVTSYVGFKEANSSIFLFTDNTDFWVPPLPILEKTRNLDDVSVTAKRPMFEQKIDRLIINVASSITNTGSTALEVLMRSPGVSINHQNNSISMQGKEGVVLMLNGKVSRMPADALVQMLSGMSAANIEKIELITSPAANFEAEGNAGFINIVLKKNTQFGINGSFSATAGFGIGGREVAGSSINFNYRKNKWNLYGDYSFDRTTPDIIIRSYRKVFKGTDSIENYLSSQRSDFRRNHNARVGLDYESNGKTTFGVLLSGFSNIYAMQGVNHSNIYVNTVLDTSIIIDNPERHPLDNYSTNFNFQHHLKKDQLVTVNLDYIFYKDANTLTYLNNFFNGTGNFLYSDKVRSNKETPIKFSVASVDYSNKLGNAIDVESGIKTTFSHFVNDVKVEREIQNMWNIDKEFTSKHTLNESVLGAYASFNITLSKKTLAKAGLRYEYTRSNLGSETKQNIIDKHYSNLFPSLFLSHSLNDKTSLNFSYSRRITRPTFNDMAPFVYFVDPNTLFSGNPALQPSVSNALKADFLFRKFIFSLAYTHENNPITDFSPQVNPVTNTEILVAENQRSKDIVSSTISLPFTITSWWNMQNNLIGYLQYLKGMYKGDALNITQPSLNINSTQSFTLPKSFSIQLNGAYQSGGLFGIYKMASTTSLNFGVQKKLRNNGGTFIFNITDFSGPPHLRFSLDAPKQNLVVDNDVRFMVSTVKLTYIKKFGSATVKENRKRTTGSEEESKRVQSN